MKKLMFVAVAALATAAFAEDITSENIVGYMTCERPQQNFCGGSMFSNVGKDSITLADLKITGTKTKAQCRNSFIIFWMAGSTPKLNTDAKYWMDLSGAWRKFSASGSYDNDPVMTAEQLAAVVINPGEGFVCNFQASGAKITYAGEVITGTDQKITIARPQQNFVVANPSASNITLADLKITGTKTKAQCRNSFIIFWMAGSTPKLNTDAKYWMDLNGKWRKFSASGSYDNDPEMTAEQMAAVVIKPGEGFVCNFQASGAQITMPTSL